MTKKTTLNQLFANERLPHMKKDRENEPPLRVEDVMVVTAAATIDERRKFIFNYGDLLETYDWRMVNPAGVRINNAMRLLRITLEYCEIKRLDGLSTTDRCRILRKHIRRKMNEQSKRASVIRRKYLMPYLFSSIRAIIEYEIFCMFTCLDIRYKEFSRYMLDAVIMESAGCQFSPEKSSAYVEYAYFRTAYDRIIGTARVYAKSTSPKLWEKIKIAYDMRHRRIKHDLEVIESIDDVNSAN